MVAGPLSLEPGTIVAERYRVERVLGRGGMGCVYEAQHLVTLRRGALKILHRELGHHVDVVARFLREASAAGRIGSTHIVETIDAGSCEAGEPYIFMELLRGDSLESELLQNGPLPFTRAVDYVRQACRGLAAAHEAGIVHRDVKPENLFLVEGEKPFVKILDFGISKFDPALTAARALTIEGSTLGTPFYMSPEQVQGVVNVDRRTDIYSLGVTLYRLLSGRYPFMADTLPAIAVLIHRGEYAPLSTLCAVPAGFDAVIARAMAKNVHDRYASALELEAALAGFDKVVPAPGAADSRRELVPVNGTTPPFAAATGSALSRTLSGRQRERRLRIALGSLAALGSLVGLALFLRARGADPAGLAPAAERSVAAPPANTARAVTEPGPTVMADSPPPEPAPSANTANPAPTSPSGASSARRAQKKAAPPGSTSPPLKPGRLGSEFTRSYE